MACFGAGGPAVTPESEAWAALKASAVPQLWLVRQAQGPLVRTWVSPHPEGGWWVQGPRGASWHLPAPKGPAAGAAPGLAPWPGALTAPMAARVASLLVADGEEVSAGQSLVVLEAMKLRLPLVAPGSGRVRLLVAEGEEVRAGQSLAAFEPLEA